jgi:hypothetical protein
VDFGQFSKCSAYKLKDGFLLNEILYNSKDELELLQQINTKICFKFNTIYHISRIHSNIKYNRLESSSLLCHQQVLLAINKYPFLGSKPTYSTLEPIVGYRTEKYPITEKSVKKKTKTFNSINKKIIVFFNIDRVLGSCQIHASNIMCTHLQFT